MAMIKHNPNPQAITINGHEIKWDSQLQRYVIVRDGRVIGRKVRLDEAITIARSGKGIR